MKKVIIILLSFIIPQIVKAYDLEENGIYYLINSTDKIASVTYGDNKYYGDIIIPSSIIYNNETYSIDSIGDNAFLDCVMLKSVSIPNSIIYIGKYAFGGCYNLDAVYITDLNAWCKIKFTDESSLRAHHFFLNDVEIIDLVIPSGITTIGNNAFAGFSGLKSISIPNSVTSIGDEAFYGCTNLQSVAIPNGVTSIGERAFLNCDSLSSITIPNSVVNIGKWGFANCSSLTSVVIPEKLETISDHLFTECESLVSVTIPNSVTCIEDGAFFLCKALTSITLPNNLSKIAEGTFRQSGLTSIIIPDSVISIEKRAFLDCSNLTSISLGKKLSSIGIDAFNNTAIKTIIIPDNVTSIGKGAFNSCSNLTSVDFGNDSKLLNIGQSAFSNCSGLKSIKIPQNIKTIDKYAFADSKIDSLIWCSSHTVGSVNNNIFENSYIRNTIFDCDTVAQSCLSHAPIGSITITDKVKHIVDEAFSGNSDLSCVIIGNNVSRIGKKVFSGCSRLTTISLPQSLVGFGEKAFYGCKWLSTITIPQSVTSIGKSAFEGCSRLTTITIPQNVVSIEANAFKGVDFETVVSLIEYPSPISPYAFDFETYFKCTLYVPIGTHYQYKTQEGWKQFVNKVEGSPSGIVKMNTDSLHIHYNGHIIWIQGIDIESQVKVYNTNGTLIGSAISHNGTATIDAKHYIGSVVIVNVDERSFKITIK